MAKLTTKQIRIVEALDRLENLDGYDEIDVVRREMVLSDLYHQAQMDLLKELREEK